MRGPAAAMVQRTKNGRIVYDAKQWELLQSKSGQVGRYPCYIWITAIYLNAEHSQKFRDSFLIPSLSQCNILNNMLTCNPSRTSGLDEFR